MIIIRIGLIVAIIAGVAVIHVQVTQLKKKVTAIDSALTARTAALGKSKADLASAREEMNKIAEALRRTTNALDTKTTEVAAQAREIAKLNNDAKKLREERDDAQAQLSAYRISIPNPEAAARVAKEMKGLRDWLAASSEENALLGRRIKRLQALVPKTDVDPIALPADLNTKVLALDPKWGFVILDAGEDQGMMEHGELLVNRGGRLVARVLITRVEKNRSVANIMPGWELTQLIEGDTAIPAHPGS